MLHGRRILLAEDEYVIAEAMRRNLEKAGAIVVGPVASVDDALLLLRTEQLDGALLDFSLRDEKVFPTPACS